MLEYATQNNVEPFLEPVLDLCHAIVQRDIKVRATLHTTALPQYKRLQLARTDCTVVAVDSSLCLHHTFHPAAPCLTSTCFLCHSRKWRRATAMAHIGIYAGLLR